MDSSLFHSRPKQHRTASRTAFTLMEVVVGLVLLGALTVSSLTAIGGLRRSQLLAARKCEAIAAADRILADWYRLRGSIPVNEHGAAPANGSLTWRTTLTRSARVFGVTFDVIRFEVVGSGGKTGPKSQS